MANRDVRLQLFEDPNFEDRRIVINRGGVAVRDARALRFNDELDSFRVRNVVNPRLVTLILFEDVNFGGDVRIYRGSQSVANLGNFSDRMSSLIVVGRRLTNAQITRIRNNRRPPADVAIIRQ